MNPARNKEKKSRPQPPPKLSETLRGLLLTEEKDKPLTVNYLLNHTEGQGIFLTMILLALPFMVPLLPGMSTPFGAAIIYLAWTQIGGKRKGLPAWLEDRPVPADNFFKIIEGTARILRFIETGFKPRFSWWLMLPGIPDKRYAYALARTHYAELIRGGVKIYEYLPGFVHAKNFVSDDEKAIVGTINLDFRSLFLHFECASYIWHNPVVDEVEADFEETLKECQRITLKHCKETPFLTMACGKILRLIAPLM